MIINHFLQLFMFHLVYLQFSQALILLGSLLFIFLWYLFLLFIWFFQHRLWHIFTILQCLLSRIRLFILFWLWNIRAWGFHFLCVYTFYLACKLLNYLIITCIFYCFFFFYIQSSPPILAPSPPKRTHSLFAEFFFSTLLE